MCIVGGLIEYASHRVDATHFVSPSYLMPRFSFRVRTGKFWNACTETAFESNAAAREEAMAIYADLARDIFGGLDVDCEWRMEVADKTGKSIFRLRLLAESPGEERPQ